MQHHHCINHHNRICSQEFGIPVFKMEIAFTIFALFNALSLFTATTTLLLFLSILTTRFSENDFLVSLPRRLIFGLFMLFLSATGMIVAFCAIRDHGCWHQ
ncbi:putative PGG domain-containing protein [Helianthus debilis subsp. tardiflorus]